MVESYNVESPHTEVRTVIHGRCFVRKSNERTSPSIQRRNFQKTSVFSKQLLLYTKKVVILENLVFAYLCCRNIF